MIFITKLFCTSGPNLVVLAWTGDELLRGQAQNGVNFDFEVKFDLEGQGQSHHKTIGISTKVFYTYGPNLVILAWTGDELSGGQSWWRTDAGNDNTRRPILALGKQQDVKFGHEWYEIFFKPFQPLLLTHFASLGKPESITSMLTLFTM